MSLESAGSAAGVSTLGGTASGVVYAGDVNTFPEVGASVHVIVVDQLCSALHGAAAERHYVEICSEARAETARSGQRVAAGMVNRKISTLRCGHAEERLCVGRHSRIPDPRLPSRGCAWIGELPIAGL